MNEITNAGVEETVPKTPPKTVPLGDGGALVVVDDGIEDNTIRPAGESLRERHQDYGGAEALLRQAADLARAAVERQSANGPAIPTRPVAPRTGALRRETGETRIELVIQLDGSGRADVKTGVGFFDHMLTLLARHSLIDLTVQAEGDLHIDAHHTVEDVGICFGKTLAQALGDKSGIRRYGDATVPMDEVLVTAAIDLSGRPFCVWKAEVPRETLGTFNAELAEEFWRGVASNAALTLHVVLHHGRNTHHIVEGIFKATARALRQAVEMDPRGGGVPSTKGVL
jgi:imidazoleglycerol-phosphate dehydratase